MFESKTRMCRNRCKFCFVDQLPEAVRPSLLEKDDDWRMSLLLGNYVTFTNVPERELDEIIENFYSPLYVSVHAADTKVRAALLGCSERAADVMRVIDRLSAAGIVLHGQIVLCPGLNDGKVLEDTVEALYGKLRSLAVVPVGITKYQKDPDITAVTPALAAEVLDTVDGYKERFLRESGSRFVWCSDEMYQRAGRGIPDFDFYEDFDQIGNGVGMIAQFLRDFGDELDYLLESGFSPSPRELSLATGKSAFGLISESAKRIEAAFPNVRLHVYAVENHFFGSSVTVAGLVTGGDIAEQLKGKELGTALLFPDTMLRAEGDMFLDDSVPAALSDRLGVPVRAIPTGGDSFIDCVLDAGE